MSNNNSTRPIEPIYAPEDWIGVVKSNTHYAWIDNKVHPIRPTKDFVYYKSRWRPIETDESGATYLEYPGVTAHFEILEFDKRPQQTDRELKEANKWWRELEPSKKAFYRFNHFGGDNRKMKLNGKIIVAMWSRWASSASLVPIDNGGELKCTEGEWYKHDNMILTKGTPHNRIGLMYIRGSVDREFRQKVDEEMEANLDLCVASKDLYNALSDLYKVTLLCRDNKKALADTVEALKKANKNYSQQDHLTS